MKNKEHFWCWMCNYEGGLSEILHISKSYLRINSIGQLIMVCQDHKDDFVDPMIIRKFRKLFNLNKK